MIPLRDGLYFHVFLKDAVPLLDQGWTVAHFCNNGHDRLRHPLACWLFYDV